MYIYHTHVHTLSHTHTHAHARAHAPALSPTQKTQDVANVLRDAGTGSKPPDTVLGGQTAKELWCSMLEMNGEIPTTISSRSDKMRARIVRFWYGGLGLTPTVSV